MQLSAKARLISVIIALVFTAGALIGSGTYLIINHIDNSNATTSTDYIIEDNLYNTDGTINASAATAFLDAIGYTDNPNDTRTYKAHQILSRNNSSSYSGDKTIVFKMGYYTPRNGNASNMDTDTELEWQATYMWSNSRNERYLTIWMANPYTDEYFNNGTTTRNGWGDGIRYSVFDEDLQAYCNYNNYSRSTLRDATNNIYTALSSSLDDFSSFIVSPSEANATWQATQAEDVNVERKSSSGTVDGISGYYYVAHHNGLRSYSGSYTGWSNYTNWDSTNPPYNDKFWMPSYVEVYNSRSYTTSTTGLLASNDGGIWGLTADDRAYGTGRGGYLQTAYDGSRSYYCWLRSIKSSTWSATLPIYASGTVGQYADCGLYYGVRPACHISLSALEDAIPPQYTISVRSNNTTYGTVNTSGGTYYEGTSVTLRATPRTGYRFVRWERNGTQVSTSATYTITVSGNYTYTAIFEPATYTVIMETSGYPSLVGGLAGGFENTGWNGTYGTEHVRSGSYSLKVTGTASTPEVTIPTTTAVPIVVDSVDKRNHVYYFQYWGYQETKAGASTQIYWPIEEPSMGSIALGPAGQWNMYSFYGTRSNNSITTSSVRIDFDNASQAGTIWFDDFLMLDLTEIFGAGNEPSKEWCDMHIISGTNTQTIQYNTSTTLETRPGGDSTIYTFAGWSTTPKTTNTTDQTVQYLNGGTVSNLTNAGGSITLYGVWEYRPFARASATIGGEVRVTGNDLGTGTTSTTVSYEAVPYTGYYLIGWYVGNTLYTQNSTTYTGTTLTLPRDQAEGVAVVPVFSTNATATPSLSFDLDTNTAITATIGGEARIIGDTYSTTDTVPLIAAIQIQDYRFMGWYIDGIQVSTDETAILSRATVLGKIVQARFAPIDSSTTNDDTDNNQTGDFVFL